MQTALEIIAWGFVVFLFGLGLFYLYAWRSFTRSFKGFSKLVNEAQESQALKQAVFQIYKDLHTHGCIRIDTAENFMKLYRKEML